MFHWQDNLYFGRTVDGHVRIVKFDSPRSPHAMWKHEDACTKATLYPEADGEFNDVKVLLDARIPPDSWASIVAAVSALGESGRFRQALDFHTGAPNDQTITV